MAKSGKGSQFERDTCRELSLWFTEGKRDDVFWRSAGSGAMAKTRSKVGKNTFGQYGDVQAVDPIGQPLIDLFSIELKRGYAAATFADMMDKKPGAAEQGWEKFVNQAIIDHRNAGSLSWWLITRRDRRDPLITIPWTISRKLFKMMTGCDSIRARFTMKDQRHPLMVSMFRFDDFLSRVKFQDIERALSDNS